ncbi:MAG: DUF6941 family protein [Planctomycetota bacterium]|jgi:hypothetical protein
MNIDAFLLCDCATDQGGKLNVLGAFDSIFARKMPAVHRACAITARIRFEKIEEGEHQVRIDVVDEDGKAVLPRLDGEISVKVGAEAGSAATNLILNLQRLEFERYGRYSINLAIDGRHVQSLPFSVREAASGS